MIRELCQVKHMQEQSLTIVTLAGFSRVSIRRIYHTNTRWFRCSLSIGTNIWVLKVNSGKSALEFGALEENIVSKDNGTDLESGTLATGDKF